MPSDMAVEASEDLLPNALDVPLKRRQQLLAVALAARVAAHVEASGSRRLSLAIVFVQQ